MNYARKEDLEFRSEDSENVFIELDVNPLKSSFIGLIYRHPTNKFTKFQEQLTHTLNKLNHFKQEYILLGDYNIDLLNHQSNSRISNYLSAIHAEGCRSTINKPILVLL